MYYVHIQAMIKKEDVQEVIEVVRTLCMYLAIDKKDIGVNQSFTFILDRGDDGGDWGFGRSNFNRGGGGDRGGGRGGRRGFQDRGFEDFEQPDPGIVCTNDNTK